MTETKTWYEVTDFGVPKINEREYIRETEKFLVNKYGQRDAKEGKYYRFFDNLPDAEAYKAELDKRRDEKVADKRIRDAAHDLLAALEDAVLWDSCDAEGEPAVWLEQAQAAIAKARGHD